MISASLLGVHVCNLSDLRPNSQTIKRISNNLDYNAEQKLGDKLKNINILIVFHEKTQGGKFESHSSENKPRNYKVVMLCLGMLFFNCFVLCSIFSNLWHFKMNVFTLFPLHWSFFTHFKSCKKYLEMSTSILSNKNRTY